MIDAKDARLRHPGDGLSNLYDLFKKVDTIDYSILNKNHTYMFEIKSKYNRVVIPSDNIDLYHIGTRDNISLLELDVDIGIKKPNSHTFKSLYDCVENSKGLNNTCEGYVIVDKFFNRVKVKSPIYVYLEYLKNNGKFVDETILQILLNSDDNFYNYFPDFNDKFMEMKRKLDKFISSVEYEIQDIGVALTMNGLNVSDISGPDFAKLVSNSICPTILFMWKKGRLTSVKDWLCRRTLTHALEYVNMIK